MKIGVVLPSVPRREELLLSTRKAYEDNTEIELAFVCPIDRAFAGIGKGWNAGVEALKDRGCDYLHLSADDLHPHPGWAEAAIEAADNGIYPSPRLTVQDGSLESCGTLGGGFYLPEVRTGSPAGSSGAPFFPLDLWEAIEPIPHIAYYSDDFVAYMVKSQGFVCQVVREYHFTHLEGTIGRPRMVAQAGQHREIMLSEVARRFAVQEREQVA